MKDQEEKSRSAKEEVWQSIDFIFHMCEKDNWSKQDIKTFQEKMQTFGIVLKDAWTESSITHYMVNKLFSFFLIYLTH